METFYLLALFSGVSVTACLFTASYLFFINNQKLTQRILGFLFIGIALRIGKSVVYYLIPEMSQLGVAIGFLGLSIVGPSLWLYTLLSIGKRHELKKVDLLHLIIPMIGFIGITSESQITPSIGYVYGTLLLFIYLAMTWITSFSKDSSFLNWNYWLNGGVTLIAGTLAYQLFSGTILNYAYGAAVAALIVYVLIFKLLKNPSLFQKRQSINIQPELISRVVGCLEDDKIYQRPALNLTQFAQHLDEPAYIISKAIKKHYGRNFPEVINALRIEEVKRRLKTDKDEFNKVEGIAYDVGFNTPSAFYAAFKKETSSSPREYQRTLVQS